MFDYIGSLVVRFFRIVFIQVKFKISLSLSNIRITTRTFKFIHRIASFQMCLLVLVLKMIAHRMCFMNERQMSKFFQTFSKKSSAILFLVAEMFRQCRAGKEEFFECIWFIQRFLFLANKNKTWWQYSKFLAKFLYHYSGSLASQLSTCLRMTS